MEEEDRKENRDEILWRAVMFQCLVIFVACRIRMRPEKESWREVQTKLYVEFYSLSLSLVTTLCSCEVVVSIVDRDDLTSRETHLVFSRHKNIMKFERILFFTQQRRSEIISSGVFDKIDWCDLSSVQLLEQLLFHLHHFAHGFTRRCANLKDHLHRIWNEKAGR